MRRLALALTCALSSSAFATHSQARTAHPACDPQAVSVQFLNRAHEPLSQRADVFRWAHTVRVCPSAETPVVEALSVFSCCGNAIGGAELLNKPERCVELSPIIFRNERYVLEVTLAGQTPCDWKQP